MIKLTLLFLITSSALVVAVTLLVGTWLATAIPGLLVTGVVGWRIHPSLHDAPITMSHRAPSRGQ